MSAKVSCPGSGNDSACDPDQVTRIDRCYDLNLILLTISSSSGDRTATTYYIYLLSEGLCLNLKILNMKSAKYIQ